MSAETQEMSNKAKRMASVCLFLFFALLSFFCAASASQSNKSFLWKMQSKTNTVYVLGSVHFMKQDIYPLDKKIEDAFDKSAVLAVEANVNDVGNLDIGKFMESAFYQGDDTLEKHVSRDTYDLVRKNFAGSGILLDLVDRQKPWFLALTLSSVGLVQLGFDPTLGIDMHFLSKAEGKKRIVELESVDYQINLLSGLSDSEQEAFLLGTMRELKTLGQEVNELVRAWKSGDTQTLESLLAKSGGEGMSSINEKILYGRNRNMASKIEDYLRTKETCFVIIGAGHLVGDRGIIEILKRKGYAVEQQ
jgi:uncharacterized protein